MKKFFVVMMCLIMTVCFMPTVAFADGGENISGTCKYNEDIIYEYDVQSGQLKFVTEKTDEEISTVEYSQIYKTLNSLQYEVKSIYYGKGIVEIGIDGVFDILKDVEFFEVEEGNPKYKSVDGVLMSNYDTDNATLLFYPGKKNLTEYTIPSGVRKVSGLAFAFCEILQKINVPETVTRFGTPYLENQNKVLNVYFQGEGELPIKSEERSRNVNYKFSCTRYNADIYNVLNYYTYGEIYLEHHFIEDICADCGATKNSVEPTIRYQDSDYSHVVKYPLDKEKDQYLLFDQAEKIILGSEYFEIPITKVIIPDTIDGVDVSRLFALAMSEKVGMERCSDIEEVVIGQNVSEICESAFYGTSIKKIVIPNSNVKINVSTIGNSQIEDLTIPISASFTGTTPYYNYLLLNHLTFTEGTGIGTDYDYVTHKKTPWYMNKGNDLNITFNDGIEYIGHFTFAELPHVEYYEIPATVKEVGDNTFYRNEGLLKVKLNEGIQEVGYLAFAENKNLKSVNIPDSLTDIKYNSFDGCPNLVLTVSKGSYGEKYAIENKIKYRIGETGSIITPSGNSSGGSGGGGGIALPSTKAETPSFSMDKGVFLTSSTDGTSVKLTCMEGYIILDVQVNGVSIGSVTEVSGLKTGDKVVISTKPISEEISDESSTDEIKAMMASINSSNFHAKSKLVKMKSGKKAIKLMWSTEDEIHFDGVEIFRSTKRNGGYGSKPIYVSKTGKFYNTSIKQGKKYYYKVRGYVVIGGEKIYSDWSSKAIRTAK